MAKAPKLTLSTKTLGRMKAGERAVDEKVPSLKALKYSNKITFVIEYISPIDLGRRQYKIGTAGELTIADARKAAQKLLAQIAMGTDPLMEKREKREGIKVEKNKTLRNWIENGWKEIVGDNHYASEYGYVERHFSEWLDKPMSEIEPQKLREWQKAYKGKIAGCNRALTALKGILTKAVAAKIIKESPADEVKLIAVDTTKKFKALTKEEEKRLMAALDDPRRKPRGHDWVKMMVHLILNTGLRKGEALNLRVSDIDFSQTPAILTVFGINEETGERCKTGKSRYIPLNPFIQSMLKQWIAETGASDYVFPNKNGGRKKATKNSMNSLFRFADINIPGKKLHALRHTFGTRLAVDHKVNIITLQKLMGHASIEMTMKYCHLDGEKMADAVYLLNKN